MSDKGGAVGGVIEGALIVGRRSSAFVQIVVAWPFLTPSSTTSFLKTSKSASLIRASVSYPVSTSASAYDLATCSSKSEYVNGVSGENGVR